MITMTLSELAKILASTSPNPELVFTGISKDSRTLIPGNLYIAIMGTDLDGHHYVEEAFKKGAAAALVSRKVDSAIPQIQVQDTIAALSTISENWRDRFTLPLIGVTGSNGKTTLKNMIASILRAACGDDANQVLATEGNLNNAIGVPLMLTRLNTQHRLGVIEMGMNNFGEIAHLTKLAKPKVAVITNAAESHLQGLKNIAGVAKAKGEIFIGLAKDGIAVLNKDDDFFAYWRDLIAEHRYLTFSMQGESDAADVTANLIPTVNSSHQQITLRTPIGKIDVKLPLLGKHNIANALAATAVALAMHLDLETIKTGLETVCPAPRRMNEIILANGTRIIDDTYNANPFSTLAAINALTQFKGKKILVLADMRELGPEAREMHALTGKRALAAGIDYLFTLGELSAAASESFGKNAWHFTDKEKLSKALQAYLQIGNTILVKGSKSMHMEQVVAQLIPDLTLAPAH